MFSKMFDFILLMKWNHFALKLFICKIARAMLLRNVAITRTWISSFFYLRNSRHWKFQIWPRISAGIAIKLPCTININQLAATARESPFTTTSSHQQLRALDNVCNPRKSFLLFSMAQITIGIAVRRNFILSNKRLVNDMCFLEMKLFLFTRDHQPCPRPANHFCFFIITLSIKSFSCQAGQAIMIRSAS